MDYRILGPLEVLDEEGRPVALGGKNQRVLLATLLLHANKVVLAEALVAELFGEMGAVPNRIHNPVSRLREALDDPASQQRVLLSEKGGYRLRVRRDEVDAHRFEDLVAEAESALAGADARRAHDLLSTALDELWRGDPLPELAGSDLARDRIRELAEAHGRARRMHQRSYAQVCLADGRAGEATDVMQRLVDRCPTDEALVEQLMRALVADGKRLEATSEFNKFLGRARKTGVNAGRELVALNDEILNEEAPSPASCVGGSARPPTPSIALPRTADAGDEQPERGVPVTHGTRRRAIIGAGAFVATLLLVLIAAWLPPGDSKQPDRAASPSTDAPASVDGRRPVQVLLLIDVSGTMKRPLDPNRPDGISRIRAVREYAVPRIDTFKPPDRIGLWLLSTSTRGLSSACQPRATRCELQPLADATPQVGDRITQEIARLEANDGGTPLYRAMGLAVRALRKDRGPAGAVKFLIVLTDGFQHEGEGQRDEDVPLAGAEDPDPSRAVRVLITTAGKRRCDKVVARDVLSRFEGRCFPAASREAVEIAREEIREEIRAATAG